MEARRLQHEVLKYERFIWSVKIQKACIFKEDRTGKPKSIAFSLGLV